MQIQSYTSPMRATQTPPPPAPKPDEPTPTPPGDSFKPSKGHPVLEAAKAVGKSGLNGAMEGIGYSYLGFLATAAGGPAVGLAVKVGCMGLGAAVAIKERGDVYEQITGSKVLGKIMAGAAGAGKTALEMGSPTTIQSAVIGGGIMGGLFGVLETPR